MSMTNENNEFTVDEEKIPVPEDTANESVEKTVEAAPSPEVTEAAPPAAPEAETEKAVELQPDEPARADEEEPEEDEDVLQIPSMDLLEKELKRSRYRSNYGRVLRSTFFSLLVVAAVAVIIAVLLMPVMQITGISMTPTLDDGDLVIALNNGKFQTGDVIGFYVNNGILIKRVIATTGDWVDIDEEGSVYVNGVMLYEPYVSEKSIGECNITLPYQVPEGKCFVMGDHRSTSIDSRNTAVGCISNDVVVGKLLLRIWPLSVFGGVS